MLEEKLQKQKDELTAKRTGITPNSHRTYVLLGSTHIMGDVGIIPDHSKQWPPGTLPSAGNGNRKFRQYLENEEKEWCVAQYKQNPPRPY